MSHDRSPFGNVSDTRGVADLKAKFLSDPCCSGSVLEPSRTLALMPRPTPGEQTRGMAAQRARHTAARPVPNASPAEEIAAAIAALSGGPTHRPSTVIDSSTPATSVARMRGGASVCMPTRTLFAPPMTQNMLSVARTKNGTGVACPTAHTANTAPPSTPTIDISARAPGRPVAASLRLDQREHHSSGERRQHARDAECQTGAIDGKRVGASRELRSPGRP